MKHVTFIAICWALLAPTSMSAQTLFWTQTGVLGNSLSERGVYRSNLDGTDVERIQLKRPFAVEVDGANGRIYFSEVGAGARIFRSNPDGSDLTLLVEHTDSPISIGLDLTNDKMYWAESSGSFPNGIHWADLDGSNPEQIIEIATHHDRVGGMYVSPDLGQIFWTSEMGINSANLDGSNVRLVNAGDPLGFIGTIPIGNLGGIVVDDRHGEIYWTDTFRNTISRVNLDGTNGEEILTDRSFPQNVDIDFQNDLIYWTDTGLGQGVETAYIRRANLDGSNVQDVLSVAANVGLFDVAVYVPEPAGCLLFSLGSLGLLLCWRRHEGRAS